MASQEEALYDIAVIGGGITGAGIARDASLRGLKVILFEKSTIGSGTSSKSSKLIHGGLRYLETAWHALQKGRLREFWKNFRFVFLALRETRILHTLAPELITPIPLLVPIYSYGKRKPAAVYFGTLLYGLLARIAGSGHSPELLSSKKKILAKEPLLNPEGLLGGVLIWDYTTDDLELVKAVMRSAEKKGLALFENTEVTGYEKNASNSFFRILTKHKNGIEKVFQARVLINAAGPWIDKVRSLSKRKPDPFLMPIAGSHLNVKPFCQSSVILEAEDGRVFFVIRRKNDCRVGTTERVYADPDSLTMTEEEESYLLKAIKKFFPATNFGKDCILERDAGIRPLALPPEGLAPSDISREHEFRMDESGIIHVLGVKLTDHRRAAEELMGQIVIPRLQNCFKNSIPRGSMTRSRQLSESA